MSKRTSQTIPKLKKGFVHKEEQPFTFPNGDLYLGQFAINVAEKSIFRHGTGTYTTYDGDVYKGTWSEDKLIDIVEISYADGSRYEGSVTQVPEYTIGVHWFKNGASLRGDFKKNLAQDVKGVKFYDQNSKIWSHCLKDGKICLAFNWISYGAGGDDDYDPLLPTCDIDEGICP